MMDGTMDEITSKERVLRRIRDALTHAPVQPPKGVDLESGIYPEPDDELAVVFAQRFIGNGGSFVYCEDIEVAMDTFRELVREQGWGGHIFCKDPVVEELMRMAGIPYGNQPSDAVLKKVVFCPCRYLVASEASILWDSSTMGRRAMALASTVVFVSSVDQVVPDFRTAVRLEKEKKEEAVSASFLARWTGLPGFTDIDGEPVKGIGPERVFLVLIDNV